MAQQKGFRRFRWGLVFLILVASTPVCLADMKVGFGRSVITPDSPVWMAGYASRTEAGFGKAHDLWAKAFAMEDASGNRVVILTADLIGLTLDVSDAVARRIETTHGIPRSNLLFNASHTHSGPVVINDGLHTMYGLEGIEQERAATYTEGLHEHLYAAIDQALGNLAPGSVSWGIGEAAFAQNRREYTAKGVINRYNPIGPIDHDVPTLVARDAKGKIVGVLFGYACHNTTVGFQEFSGDYAGYAQIHVEKAYPGATALFAAGCGGDQNPLPRRTVELAEKYGRELGEAVERVVDGGMTLVSGGIETKYKIIPLALTKPPTEAEVTEQLGSHNKYVKLRAKKLKRLYETEGAIPTSIPYPVQVWKLGDTVQLTALSGEVTVDYSLLIKHHYPREKQFVMGYSNDCPAYIPSLRVLREGGYEGGDSMVYYGIHGPWAPSIEEDIMNAVHELAGR
ncbi:MAG: neutral/alkaline non-lysosomal ceramidase N-terminal domain-containing protein [Candidatus Hydrogenedentota bacterium]